MRLCVDAWLERRDPLVTLRDADSGRAVARWQGMAVGRLLEEGGLALEDLLAPLSAEATRRLVAALAVVRPMALPGREPEAEGIRRG